MPWLWPAVVILILVALYFLFDRRYHGRPNARQRPTGEVFRDPTTGKRMRVYEDPVSGARSYRQDLSQD
ncbi:MAG: hypothetical protein ACRD04_02795 [Terriglobales bacterium]